MMLSIKNLLSHEFFIKLISRLKSEVVLFIFILLWGLFLSVHSNKQIQFSTSQLHAQQKQALAQLNHIEDRIAQLTTSIDKASMPQTEIQTLNQQLVTLQHTLGALEKQTANMPTQQMAAEENQKLEVKLNTIQHLLEQLKKQATSPHHLVLQALPFQVIGIDIWNGQPMATVRIGGEFALMAINDSRASWTLTSIDFDTSQAIFKNSQNQYLKVKV